MKKYRLFVFLLSICLFLSGCGKEKTKDISIEEVTKRLALNAEIASPEYLDLSQKENAESFLLATEDFEKGIAVYSKSTEEADKIILIKAKDSKTVQDVERSLSAVLIGLTTTWENDENEAKKVEEHILKTKDKYVLLYVGQKNEEAEKIFDESF